MSLTTPTWSPVAGASLQSADLARYDRYKRNYSRKPRNDAPVKPIHQILSNPIMNPLGLSVNAMIKSFEYLELW
jgi:hypothetical protein